MNCAHWLQHMPHWIVYWRPAVYLAFEFNVLLMSMHVKQHKKLTVEFYALAINCLCLMPLIWIVSYPFLQVAAPVGLGIIAVVIVCIVFNKRNSGV